MSTSFKCCRNKSQNNFICCACYSLFHPSCLERLNGHRVVDRNIIMCSQACVESFTGEAGSRTDELLSVIQELRSELQQKNEFIKRLKRSSTAFQEEASSAESELISEIDSLTELNGKLRVERDKLLSQLTNRICSDSSTQTTVSLRNTHCQTALEQLCKSTLTERISLIDGCSQTISPVDNLSGEHCPGASLGGYPGATPVSGNDHRTEMTALQDKCSQTEFPINESSLAAELNLCTDAPRTIPSSGSNIRSNGLSYKTIDRPQMLVMGNKSSVLGCSSLIKKNSTIQFDINCQFGTRLLLEEIFDRFFDLSRRFTKRDYVILFYGNADAFKGTSSSVNEKLIGHILDKFSHTNLIIVGPPYAASRPILNNFTYESDLVFKKILCNGNDSLAKFFSFNEFSNDSELNYYGNPSFNAKRKLVDHLISKIFTAPSNSDIPMVCPTSVKCGMSSNFVMSSVVVD